MNWDDLKVFLAIAEAGTLAGAARSLSVNHSTVFRRLNALEEGIGVRLFDRLPDGYVLTPAGERMQALGRTAETAIQDIERELAGHDLAPTGVVRLTAAPDIASTIIPPAVLALRKSHPGIVVEVLAGDSDYDLNRREADIALRATSRPPENLVGRRLMGIDWCVCGRSRDRRAPGTAAELSGRPMVGADSALLRLAAFQWLEADYHDSIVARANDLTTIASLIIAGVGYSVLPSNHRESGLKPLFKLPGTSSEMWLLTHPDLRNVRRIRAVWDALVEAIGNDPNQPPSSATIRKPR
ncbi:MAG: LysR family transcriptional regulator [Woeseiaceae bacterium]|nr:LysR family transcriptional regulator [Woeseiaceae bacterium]